MRPRQSVALLVAPQRCCASCATPAPSCRAGDSGRRRGDWRRKADDAIFLQREFSNYFPSWQTLGLSRASVLLLLCTVAALGCCSFSIAYRTTGQPILQPRKTTQRTEAFFLPASPSLSPLSSLSTRTHKDPQRYTAQPLSDPNRCQPRRQTERRHVRVARGRVPPRRRCARLAGKTRLAQGRPRRGTRAAFPYPWVAHGQMQGPASLSLSSSSRRCRRSSHFPIPRLSRFLRPAVVHVPRPLFSFSPSSSARCSRNSRPKGPRRSRTKTRRLPAHARHGARPAAPRLTLVPARLH